MSSKLAAILTAVALLAPATADARRHHARAPTIRQAQLAIVRASPIEVIPSHCHMRRHWTDCYVTAPLEETATDEEGNRVPIPVSFGGALHWTSRVCWHHGHLEVTQLG